MGGGTEVQATKRLIGPFNAMHGRLRSGVRADNPRCPHLLKSSIAPVVKQVDTGDLKSPASERGVPVRIRPGAPTIAMPRTHCNVVNSVCSAAW